VTDAARRVHGFPAALTSFVGRVAVVDQIAGQLNQYRLVTVTGPGGAGKTRLAAARVEALGVAQLLDRIDDRFTLLETGDRLAPARQRSLAATVEWSYRLLDERERRVFRAVSVFPGPFTLEGAEAVAGGASDRRQVGAVALADEGAVEGEDLADHPAGLVAVVNDQGADADVDGQHLEAQVGDEADALRPISPQGFLAPDHPVAADHPDGHRGGEEDVVGEVREQRVNVVRVPVLDPLLREGPCLGLIHPAMLA
jgi:hypothetical protein